VLKPSQQYNLAKVCKIDILDRERLILDIFELRASTAESGIQIKLAQLRYDMVRAREKVRLARAGEQPGFFGMGKYDADVYFLDIKKRSAILKKKLEREEKRRELFRIQRSRAGLPTISIAGYTSAGKTTLFNTLTGESKMEGKEVFTTLSTFTRAINLKNDKKLLISDTVGFISKLPAYMIDAFKSTLQDITYSDLVLLVVDISQSIEEIKKKLDSSIHLLLMTKL
jgi:GTPase